MLAQNSHDFHRLFNSRWWKNLCLFSSIPPTILIVLMITYKVSQYINKYSTLWIKFLFLSWVSSPNNRSIVNVLCPNIFCDLHYSQAGITPTRDFPLLLPSLPRSLFLFFFLPHYFQCQNPNMFISVLSGAIRTSVLSIYITRPTIINKKLLAGERILGVELYEDMSSFKYHFSPWNRSLSYILEKYIFRGF